MLQFWTDFADGSIMFPLGAAVAVLLALFGHRRAALAWTVVLGSVWAIMLALKFCGYALAATFPASPLNMIDLVTPSGHVASSATVVGGLAALLLHRPGSPRIRAVVVGLVVAVGIGVTRVLLDDHSAAEVVIGGLVGLGGLVLMTKLARMDVGGWVRPVILAAAALIVLREHGNHLTWELSIHRLSLETVSALNDGVRAW